MSVPAPEPVVEPATTKWLYVSEDLHWFMSDSSQGLAIDIRQGDADRQRLYRRINSYWYNWLATHRKDRPGFPIIRSLVVELFGAERVKIQDTPRMYPNRYQPPEGVA